MGSSLFMQSVRDFFTLKMMKYSVVPFIVTMILLYGLFFYFAGSMLDQLHHATLQVMQSQSSVQNGVVTSSTTTSNVEGSSSIINFLLTHFAATWALSFLFYIVGTMLVLAVSIVIAVIVISFLTPFILKEIKARHYPEVEMKGEDNIFGALWHVIVSFLIMLVMYILFIPFYFIPILNVIVLNLPMYYLFHKILTYDVASNIVSKTEQKKIMFFAGNSIRLRTFLLYLISLIPFAILFGGVFYVIFIGHTYFVEAKKLRASFE
jgi:hypothetical protein